MSNLPFVTIAIPFYNSGSYLQYSIQSVIHQKYDNWELILIDDGSSDESKKTAEYFALKDSRIKVLSDGENHGLARRLNETIRLANGEYYFRMDADDIMFPDRIEKQVDYLINNKNIDVLGSSAVIIDSNNELQFRSRRGAEAPICRQDVLRGNIFIHPTIAGKTTWFRQNTYDENMRRSQDFFLWLNSVEHSKFAVLDEPLLFYRVENNDLWGKFKRDNRTSYEYFKKQLKKDNIVEPLTQILIQQIRFPLFYIYYKIRGGRAVIKRRYEPLTETEKSIYHSIMNKVII